MMRVARFAHGSRVPGWDEAADLEKDPSGVPDPALVAVPEQLRAEIEAAMARYPDRHSATLPALAAAQRLHGWCSPEALEQVACVMRVTPAYLSSVASFYDMFELEPVGRHSVYVCTNISCSLRGADALYAEIEVAADGDPEINVRSFECLGACDIAPMVSVDQRLLRPAGARRRKASRRGPAGRPRTDPRARPCAAPHRGSGREQRMSQAILFKDIDEPGLATLEVYERRGGYQSLRKALAMEPAAVVAELDASGLRGRGGAGFPAGRKAAFLPQGDMDKYLVCNADESEPGTFKDRELMAKSPHMLIEGIMIAAHAAGANHAFIYIRGEYEEQARILDAALAEAAAAGYTGQRILGSGTPARSSSTAAPAPTSAVRRPGCSTRSRASAETPGSSRRSRRRRASTRGRR